MSRKELNNIADKRIRAKSKFVAITMRFHINNLDYSFNKQFQMWLLKESHEKEYLGNFEDYRYDYCYEFNEKGFITNAKFSGKTRAGLELTEKDFIGIELKRINSIETDLLNISAKKHLDVIRDLLNEKAESKPEKVRQEVEQSSIHTEYNPNLWNKEAYELFKYLYDYYYLADKPTNVKLASIWHYFNDYKNLDKIKDPKYILHATKDKYKEFIKSYGIEITNMDAKNSYDTKHKPIIDDHRQNYENGLSILQNT